MNRTRIYFLFVAYLTLLGACGQNDSSDSEVIVIYDDKILYRDELNTFIPQSLLLTDSTKYEDSVYLAQKFIDQWIRDQAIEEAARKSIKGFGKRINYQVDNYRRRLIHHEYAKWIVANRLDTLVTEDEIRNYYQNNSDKFISKGSYYSYFHVRTEQTNQYKPTYWMRSKDPAELELLRQWCEGDGDCVMQKIDSVYLSNHELQVAGEGYYADISRLKKGIPYVYYTKKDKQYTNFLKLIDVIKPGDTKPLVLCKEEIVEIILRNRKNVLVKQIEDDLLVKARQNDRFSIE